MRLARPKSRLSRRPLTCLAAVGVSAGLVALSAAPGVAATPVARASAAGLVLTVASQPVSTGAFSVVNDGTKQTATGNDKPTIQALGNQPFLSVGTLAQEATTKVVDKRGSSAACAGLAGSGASLVAAGDGNCLTPGKQLSLSAGTLDLSKVTIVKSDVLAGLDTQLQTALQPLLNAVVPAVQSGLQSALKALGNPDVSLNLGAIQSSCTSTPSGTDGDSDLADAALTVTLAGQKVNLLSLPVHPKPNTKLLTGLDQVVDALNTALQSQLKNGLNGVLAPAGPLVNQLLSAINDNVVKAVDKQLAPLEENVLDGTLNEQKRGPRSITVTALDLHVLPAAKAAGLDLLSAQIGQSSCGPNGRVVVDTPKPPAKHHHHPKVPTSVPAGVSGTPTAGDAADRDALIALVALAGVSGAAGVTTYRRLRRS